MTGLNDTIVAFSPTGRERYHTLGCAYARGADRLTLRDAWNRGLFPCGTCKAPYPDLTDPPPPPPTFDEVYASTTEAIRAASFDGALCQPTTEWEQDMKRILRQHNKDFALALGGYADEQFGPDRKVWAT